MAWQGAGVTPRMGAFRQLLAGYLFGGERVFNDDQGDVLSTSLGNSDLQLLAGKLIRFIDVIEQSQQRLSGLKPVSEWIMECESIWHDWFDDEQLPQEVLAQMDKSIESLEEQVAESGFDRRRCNGTFKYS